MNLFDQFNQYSNWRKEGPYAWHWELHNGGPYAWHKQFLKIRQEYRAHHHTAPAIHAQPL